MDSGTPSKKAKTSAAAGATPQKPWKADQILTPEKLTPKETFVGGPSLSLEVLQPCPE